jgi:hypothetical protein
MHNTAIEDFYNGTNLESLTLSFLIQLSRRVREELVPCFQIPALDVQYGIHQQQITHGISDGWLD